MKLEYLEVTKIRPVCYPKTIKKKKVYFQGVEIVAKTPTGSKINVESISLFKMPLLDYDKQMINQAKKTALRRLDQDQQSRMKICYGDSSKYKDDKVDCVLAANFSYFVFKDRINLIKYFQNARSQTIHTRQHPTIRILMHWCV